MLFYHDDSDSYLLLVSRKVFQNVLHHSDYRTLRIPYISDMDGKMTLKDQLRVILGHSGCEGKRKEEAVEAILKAVNEAMPDERKGPHLGHAEDDGYCYQCQDIVPEEERASFGDWAWNACLNEVKERLGR